MPKEWRKSGFEENKEVLHFNTDDFPFKWYYYASGPAWANERKQVQIVFSVYPKQTRCSNFKLLCLPSLEDCYLLYSRVPVYTHLSKENHKQTWINCQLKKRSNGENIKCLQLKGFATISSLFSRLCQGAREPPAYQSRPVHLAFFWVIR